MGIRQHIKCELRLSTNSVQARSIKNYQPLLEQRMREINNGITPARNINTAITIQAHCIIGAVGIKQSKAFSFFNSNALGAADFFKRLDHAIAVIYIKLKYFPFIWITLVFG